MTWWALGIATVDLAIDLGPFLLALAASCLVRNRMDFLLGIANLALLMELVSTILDADYRFASLFAPRLAASMIQLAVACTIVGLWRQRQQRLRSLAAQ